MKLSIYDTIHDTLVNSHFVWRVPAINELTPVHLPDAVWWPHITFWGNASSNPRLLPFEELT